MIILVVHLTGGYFVVPSTFYFDLKGKQLEVLKLHVCRHANLTCSHYHICKSEQRPKHAYTHAKGSIDCFPSNGAITVTGC